MKYRSQLFFIEPSEKNLNNNNNKKRDDLECHTKHLRIHHEFEGGIETEDKL